MPTPTFIWSHYTKLFLFGITLFLSFLPLIINSLEGPHVCQKEIVEPQKINVPAKVPKEIPEFVWCPKFPPRCRTTKTIYVDGFKEQISYIRRYINECCEGYAEAKGKAICIPICSKQCIHGICSAPEKCECRPGWAGSNCNTMCPPGMRGHNCSDFCQCFNGAKCDSVTGECTCSRGWIGKDCSKPCSKGLFGVECLQKCDCENEAVCDHITGKCNCPPGFKGVRCESRCDPNEIDDECDQSCHCENGGKCDVLIRKCICPPGYHGLHCENPCPDGTYGEGCSQTCNCEECDIRDGCAASLAFAAPAPSDAFTSNFLLLTISCFLMLALCVTLLTLYRYRERWNKLRLDPAYVTYVADRSDHVDNPVYSFTSMSDTKLLPSSTNTKSHFSLKDDLCLTMNNQYRPKPFDDRFTESPPPSWESLGACGKTLDESDHDTAYLNVFSPNSSNSSDNYKEPIYAEIKGQDFSHDSEHLYDHPKPTRIVFNDLDRDDPKDSNNV